MIIVQVGFCKSTNVPLYQLAEQTCVDTIYKTAIGQKNEPCDLEAATQRLWRWKASQP